MITMLLLLGSYKLGSYNAKNPGKLAELCRWAWVWINNYVRS